MTLSINTQPPSSPISIYSEISDGDFRACVSQNNIASSVVNALEQINELELQVVPEEREVNSGISSLSQEERVLNAKARWQKVREAFLSRHKKRTVLPGLTKLLAALDASKNAFTEEVAAFKLLIKGDTLPVTMDEKIAYRLLMKSMRLHSIDQLESSELKELLLRQKISMIQRESMCQDLAIEGTPEILMVRGRLDIDADGIATAADAGWESANVIDSTKAHNPTPPPESGTVAEAEVAVASSGGVQVAPLLNVTASGICLLLTVWQAANYADRSYSHKKVKKLMSSLKKENLEISEKIDRLVREKEGMMGRYGLSSADEMIQELNNSITYLRLDKDSNEEALSQLSGKNSKEIQELKEMLEDLGLSTLLSSAYFSSSVMAAWAPATVSFGIAGNVIGGVVYGSLLAWAAAKGLKSDIQILKGLNEEIVLLEKRLERLERHKALPFFEAKKMYLFLKINNFKNYRRLIHRLSATRNTFVVGLGSSSALAGGFGSAVVLGAEGVAVTGLAITGYGVIAFLAGALAFGVAGLSKKYHLVGRTTNFFRRQIGKKTGDKGKQLYANFVDLNRDIKKASKEHNKLVKQMDVLSKEINEKLCCNLEKSEIEPLYDQLLETAKKVVQVLELMELKKDERTDYQLFVEASGNKAKKAAASLMATIDDLDGERAKGFARAFGLYEKTFRKLDNLDLQKRYLKSTIAADVVTPHDGHSETSSGPILPFIPPVLL